MSGIFWHSLKVTANSPFPRSTTGWGSGQKTRMNISGGIWSLKAHWSSSCYKRLIFQDAYPDDSFLRADFVRAACLGDFKLISSSSPEPLTVEQYGSRVWSVVTELTYQVYSVKNIDLIVKIMVECFSNPALEGYKLDGSRELRPILQRMISLLAWKQELERHRSFNSINILVDQPLKNAWISFKYLSF